MRQVSAALIGGRAEPDELRLVDFVLKKSKDPYFGVIKVKNCQSSTDCQSGDPEMQGGRGFHRLCRADD